MKEVKNTELWDELFVTDPAAVKPITGKTYKGNSPKPYWLVKRATEVFGAAGQGWGIQVKTEGFIKVSDTDTLHNATVIFWYMRDGARCEVEHTGGTKAAYLTAQGKLMVDEDAAKKSVTDAMVKAMSLVGFAGDIFTGRWDDSKYLEEAYEVSATRESEISRDKSTAALAKAQAAAEEVEQKRQSTMLDLLAAMQGSGTVELLKKNFAALYKLSHEGAERAQAKQEYDGLLAKLNEVK